MVCDHNAAAVSMAAVAPSTTSPERRQLSIFAPQNNAVMDALFDVVSNQPRLPPPMRPS